MSATIATGETTTITYLGHSSLLLEVRGAGGNVVRILLDPGNLTPPVDDIAPVEAVLVTHSHPDHLDPTQIRRLTSAGTIAVFGPADLKEQLRGLDVKTTAVEPGRFEIAGLEIIAAGHAHETIYSGVPLPQNLSYTIADRVFAPGDSLKPPADSVDVLLAPLAGPWMKVSEGVDFVRNVAPKIAIPVHDAGLGPAHRGLHRTLFASFAPENTEVKALDRGESISW